jgi:hypothetical protein
MPQALPFFINNTPVSIFISSLAVLKAYLLLAFSLALEFVGVFS